MASCPSRACKLTLLRRTLSRSSFRGHDDTNQPTLNFTLYFAARGRGICDAFQLSKRPAPSFRQLRYATFLVSPRRGKLAALGWSSTL